MLNEEQIKGINIVASEIYQSQKNSMPLWYSKLVYSLISKLSKRQISLYYDILTDCSMLEESWKQIDNKWYRSIELSELGICMLVQPQR